MMPYRTITDWSATGRKALVATHALEIRCLLEEAFSTFLDEPDASLRAYGFTTNDAVAEAADWSLCRFRDGDIDIRLIRPEDQSFRLFTRVNFWLAQKAGPGYRRIKSESQRRTIGIQVEVLASNATEPSDTMLSIARTLQELALRTCPTLVEYWFQGSLRMRSEWFGWEVLPTSLPDDISSKNQSLFKADALFRFSALFARLVRTTNQLSAQACAETWFSPCKDLPPYHVSEQEVAQRLKLPTPREAQRERHAGLVTLIGQTLSVAEASAGQREATGAVLRAGLRPGLLHAYKIEDSSLSGRLMALPREL